jgi:hypothetical protein
LGGFLGISFKQAPSSPGHDTRKDKSGDSDPFLVTRQETIAILQIEETLAIAEIIRLWRKLPRSTTDHVLDIRACVWRE